MRKLLIILFLATLCFGAVGDREFGGNLLPDITDTHDLGSLTLEWDNVFSRVFTGDGSGLTGIGTGTGGVINTGSTTIGADSDADGVGILVLQTRGITRLTVANNGDIVIAGTVTGGVWNGTAIDISDFTNLAAGTNITLSGDTLNVDDAFLVNNASDTTTGVLTTAGITITTGNALTLGTTQWDDGSDRIEGNVLADNSVDDDALDFTSITLNDFIVDIASTQLTDTADIMYLADFDTFSELQTQIADKTLLNEEDAAIIDSAWTFSAGISGAVIGNASTATALQTARSIGMAGDINATGVAFDGTAPITLTTTYEPLSIVNDDVSNTAVISADKLTDGATNAIVTLTQESNWDTHLTSDGSDHTFLDQDVTIATSPVFFNTNMTGNVSVWTNDAGYITSTASDENIQDVTGGMVSGNTESNISVTYDDLNGKLDFVVDNPINLDVVGNASTATALQTARTIGMTGDVVWTSPSFDGTANVSATSTIQPDSVALTTDTTGNYVASITDGDNGIDGGDGGSEGAMLTLSFDSTELDALTWSDGANASNNWGFNVSGQDHIMSAADGRMNFSHDIAILGDDLFMATNTNRFVLMGDGTNYNPEAIDLSTDTTGDFVNSITGGTGIDSTGATSGENISHTLSFDSTEIDATTWSDGSNASNIWTFDVSGTDHTMTAGSGRMTFSGAVTVSGIATTSGLITQFINADAPDTWDIGETGTRFQDGFFNGTLNVGTMALSSQSITDSGGAITLGVDLITVDLIPTTGGIEEIGTAAKPYSIGEITTLNSTTINLGTATANAGMFSMIQGAVASDPTFSITQSGNNVTIDQTIGDMTITTGGGEIGFGDENLSTTGDVNAFDVIVDNIIVAQGDSDTFINIGILADQYSFQAGGINFMRFLEAAKGDNVTINIDGSDVDTIMTDAASNNLFVLDGALAVLRLGDGGTTDYAEFSNAGVLTLNGTTAAILNIGSGATGVDYIQTFDGEDADGIITWLEDEDRFAFSDHVALDLGVLYFQETTTPTAITNYGAIYTKSINELFFQDGAGVEHLLHGDAFSDMWFHSATAAVVTIGTEDAFAKIDSFVNIREEDDLGNATANTTNNEITIGANGGGKYSIAYHTSITATGASREMVICAGVELTTPLDITDVTDNTVSPIVITSVAHGRDNGDMVEISGVLGNTAANGSFIVDSKAADTFEIVALDGTATTGNGDYNEGSPTGDVTIIYPGNLVMHREVSQLSLGVGGGDGDFSLVASDQVALYAANLDAASDLNVFAVNLKVFRIGD